MAMDNHHALMDAWQAIVLHPAFPDTVALVTSDDVEDAELKEMLKTFDAMPMIPTNDGGTLAMDTPEDRKTLKYGWLRDQWLEDGLWHPEDHGNSALKRTTGEFFRNQYLNVIGK